MKEINIHLLELEDLKYYLTYSLTKSPKEVVETHLSDTNKIEWTSNHKPKGVVKSFKGTMNDLKDYSIVCMNKYGVSNIRGTFIDHKGLRNCNKSSVHKTLLTTKDDLIDPLLECLDDPLDIRVLKMGSGTKRFYVINSMDPQDFYTKMSLGLLPDDILDVPIAITGSVNTSKDLFNRLIAKYGDNTIGFLKS